MAEMIFPVPTLIKNVSTPVDATDAATKGYTDAKAASVYKPPAGSNNYVQYKSGTSFAASANLIFDPTTKTLTVDKIAANGSLLTSIANTSIVGKVASSVTSDTVTASNQPNITSVGTLSSLSVSGNVTVGGSITVSGNLNYQNVTDLVIGDPLIYIGAENPTNVVDLGIVASYTESTEIHTGLVRDHTDGVWKLFDNVDAEPTTTIDFANATYASFKAGNATLGNLVSANYFSGSGNLLSNIQGQNVSGYVANANVANIALSVEGGNVIGTVANANVAANATYANIAGTVSSANQPNITRVGILTSLSVSGNVSAANIKSDHLLYANGNPWVFTMNASGTNTYVQFNDNNSFAGSSSLTFNKVTGALNATSFVGDGSQITNVDASTLNGSNAAGFASAAQGALADTALQASALNGYATETYVNTAISNIPSTDFTGYATESYVDDAISNIPPADFTGYATEQFVNTSISSLVDAAPNTLNTLNELAAALGDDANYATTITNALANKLSTSAFTSTADTWLGTKTTSNLSEGTNQYYTVARANTAIDNKVTKAFVESLNPIANLASVANVALSVDGANVSGAVANASHATTASTAHAVTGSNVTGQVANALVAGTVYSNAQPNITSVGTLSSLSVSGNITAPFFIGNVVGNISGNLTVPGNNSEVVFNKAGTAGTSPNFIFNNATDTLIVDGTVESSTVFANTIIGDGSNITGILANSIVGVVANAYIAETVSSAHQPNITSVGPLSNLTVTGVIDTSSGVETPIIYDTVGTPAIITYNDNIAGDVGVGGNLTVGVNSNLANVVASHFIGNGSQLTGLPPSYTNANVDSYLPTYSGNAAAGNLAVSHVLSAASITVSGNISGANNISANYFIGNGAYITNANAASLNGFTETDFATAAQGLLADSAIQVGNDISLLTNDAGYLVAANLTGYATETYVDTAINSIPGVDLTGYATETYVNTAISDLIGAAPSALDTLNELAAALDNDASYAATITTQLSEKLDAADFNTTAESWVSNYSGNVTANMVTATYFFGDGSQLTGLPATYTNSNVESFLPTYSGNLSAVGSIIATSISGNGSGLHHLAGSNVTGNVGNAVYAYSVDGANVDGAVALATNATTVTSAAQPNITSVGTLSSLIVSGHLSGNTANFGSGIVQGTFVGDGGNITNISASTANTANTAIKAGTVTTAAQPNITSVGTLTSLSVTGNITTSGTFVGNGSQLTGVVSASATTAGTVTTAAQPNITSVGTLTSLSVTGTLVATTGVKTANIIDTSGTTTLVTRYNDKIGDVGILGNLTVGTGGAGNISGGYLLGAFSNVTSTLVVGFNEVDYNTVIDNTGIETNNVLASGNITANYFIGDGSQLTGISSDTSFTTEYLPASSFEEVVSGSPLTLSNATYSTSIYKFTDGISLKLANTYQSIPLSGQTLPATFEFWYYPLSTNTSESIFQSTGSVANTYVQAFSLQRSGTYWSGGVGDLGNQSGSGITFTIPQNQWSHVVLYLAPSSFTTWINGTRRHDNVTLLANSGGVNYQQITARTGIRLGESWGTANGHWSSISITSGDKYGSSNSSITVPTASFSVGGNVTHLIGPNLSDYYLTTDYDIESTGNITANYFIGDGSQLTGLAEGYSNADAASYLLINSGNIAANYFIGNGSSLTHIAGGNVDGQVANATVAGTVYTAAQPNITSLGSLTGLTVSNTSGIVNFTTTAQVKLGAVGNLSITGGTSGQYLKTDGSGTLSWGTVTTTPSGSDTQIQFNDAGVYGASAGLTFNKTTSTLSANVVVLKKYNETVLSSTNTSTSISPDVSQGTIFRYTANASFTFNSLTNAVAGTSVTVIITQDATGSRVMTSTMKFAGGIRLLSTAANSIDIISVFYDGTTYYASLSKGFA